MKFLRLILAFTLILSMAFAITVNAGNFRDVPSNHFAAEAIRWVSSPANGSFMVGDAAGNFNPTRVTDSFETAIILAMAAGFTYSPASITPAQQVMFDRAYEQHGQLLANMAATHPNWRRATNREIAFLLELGILTQSDLANFMTPGGNAAPLTKEAASAFILRLAGHDDFTGPGFSFRDNSEITQMYRRYAYLAHELGVVTDYNGYFEPRRLITRAELAQMFHTLRIAAPGTPGAAVSASASAPPPASAASSDSPFSAAFHGTISSITIGTSGQPSSVQITTEYGTGAYVFGNNPIIVVNDVRRGISDLSPGMLTAVGLDSDGRIISMLARTNAATTPGLPVQGGTPPVQWPVQPIPTPTPATNSATIQGNLTGRHFVNIAPVLTVEDRSGNTHNLPIAADTYITRNGLAADWTYLRIGDEITAQTEFNRPVSIYATGETSSASGILEEIHITLDLDTILIRQANDVVIRLALPPEIYDIYTLRLGMEIRVYIDSREIYDMEVLTDIIYPNQRGESFIGYIQSLRHGHTMVVSRDEDRQTIRVDGNTVNTATDQVLNFRDLRTGMRLYIVMQPDSNNAQSITILP